MQWEYTYYRSPSNGDFKPHFVTTTLLNLGTSLQDGSLLLSWHTQSRLAYT